MADTQNTPNIVSQNETEQIGRALLTWFNESTVKPAAISFEYLNADCPGLTLSAIQAAYKVRQYITGGYMAQYQFKLVYRVQPVTSGDRLSADEALNALADWATSATLPTLSGGRKAVKLTANTRSALFAAYDDGSEDHHTLFTFTYEVI